MKRVAVIDDDSAERVVLRGLIEDAGFEVSAEGGSAGEALDICLRQRPDVVLMDVRMPGADGIEATMEINLNSPTPVVLSTGSDDPGTIKRAVEAGVMAYLAKPVRAEELSAAIELAASRFAEFERLRGENADLKETLEARKLTERAKGLLMEKEGLTEGEAYARIRKISMDRRKTMREVAAILIEALGGSRG